MSTSSSASSAQGRHRYLAIGKYQVVHHLATGGMGAVYKALDTENGQQVALKVLSPELSANPVRLERFRREARHSQKLRHENVATVYQFGEANGIHYLALEYVDGTDLHQHIRAAGQLDPEEAVLITTHAAQALHAAHQEGLVHRDIKPSNILLAHTDAGLLAKLTDFGCARLANDDEFRLTETGHTVGTVDYMAPEQARDGKLADIRSDLYSLGCTLYHMLAGDPPFAEGTLTERLYKHSEAEVPDVRRANPRVPAWLWGVLQKLLAKKPKERYQTPGELLEDLTRPHPDAAEPAAAPDPEETSPLVAVTAEQRQAAAELYEKAKEVAAGNNLEYGIQLLLNACRLNPGQLLHRKVLRKVEKLAAKQNPKAKAAWLSTFAGKAKFALARKSGDHRKVLDYGEEMLVHNPNDADTQAAMSEAAGALGLPRLALWLMEQARRAEPRNLDLCRASARLYEQLGLLPRAIALWEQVRKADPTDAEASRKVKDLQASDTIARGNYAESLGGMGETMK
jgi:serine/threonine protein kinase